MARRVALATFAMLGALATAVGGARATARDTTRVRIDSLCAERDVRARSTEPQRFARIFAAAEPQAIWRVADSRTLARIRRDPDIYSELATVWSDVDGVAIVAIAINSLDYRAQTAYCYRPSGTLARIDETSSGTTNIDLERRYLDDRGTIVGSDSKLSPLFPQPNFTISPDVAPAKPDLYRTVRALPFYGLLASP